MPALSILAGDSADLQRCTALAAQLALPLCAELAALPADCVAYLCYRDDRLQLRPADARQSGPIEVDFCAGANAHRLQGGAELIVKAVRGRSRQPLRVLDATAGLGRDSFVLAGRGFAVSMLERSPVVAALLADGLARARDCADAAIAAIAARMILTPGDAIAHCAALLELERPDVVYLDPMFPAAQKSALVKKEMRLFQQLFHHAANDDAALLQQARATARLRVVVKRPLRAEPLAGVAGSYTLAGKAVRFDVYPSGRSDQ
jgi:16S rRNA (guanine1516-N2)-methyltransferase